MPSPLDYYLDKQTRLRAYREAGMAAQGLGQATAAPQAQGQGQGMPQGMLGLQQKANQRGGQTPAGQGQASQGQQMQTKGLPSWAAPVLGAVGTIVGGPLGGVAGSMLGGALAGSSRPAPAAARPPAPASESELYQQYQSQALAGQAGQPQGQLQTALRQGTATIQAQAQRSRETLMSQLGRRGLLHSGLLSSGLADIEAGRLQAVGELEAALRERAWEAARQAQEAAAGRYTGQAMQTQRIRAAEPDFWQSISPLLGAGAQMYFQSRQPSFAQDLLTAQRSLGTQTPQTDYYQGTVPTGRTYIGPDPLRGTYR